MGLQELLQLCDSRPNPVLTEKEILSFLTPEEKTALIKKKIITQASSPDSILCSECFGHETTVIYKEGVPTGFCSKEDGERFDIEEQEINRFSIIFDQIIDFISLNLSLRQRAAELLPEELWSLGSYTFKNTDFSIFVIAGSLAEKHTQIFENIKKSLRPTSDIICFTLLSNPQSFIQKEGLRVLTIPLHEILSIKKALHFEKELFEKFILTNFAALLFDLKNGQLFFRGKLTFAVELGSEEFKFLEILYRNPDIVVSYSDIQRYCKATSRAASAQAFCYKIKSSLKEVSHNSKTVDTIIIPGRTKDSLPGYKIRSIW